MFVRAQKFLLKDRHTHLLSFCVMESYRDETKCGSPRNRVVSYLGSIQEKHLNNPVKRALFWQTVDRKLALLLLPKVEEQRLKSKLAKRIPRPTIIPVLKSIARKEMQHQLASSVRPQESVTSEDVDAVSPSLTELGQWLTELLRRVG